MRRTAFVLAAVMVLAACSDSGVSNPGDDSTTTTTTTTTASSTTTTDPDPIDSDDVPALAVYLAAIDDGLRDTKYEGEAFTDPESFIVTGRLFCELLEEGLSVESVLSAYVAALGSSGETVDEDDYLLGGVVLGASVKLICPEFGEDLGL